MDRARRLAALLAALTLGLLAGPGWLGIGYAAKLPSVISYQGAQDAGATVGSYPTLGAGATSASVIRTLRVTDDGELIVAMTSAGSTTVDTELSASAAAADATANPTAGGVRGFGHVYNGTTWDRLRSVSGANSTTGTGLLGIGLMAFDGTDFRTARAASIDGLGSTVVTGCGSMLYNGTSHDRQRNNGNVSILASAARTTAQAVTFTNYNGRGVHVVLDVTAIVDTPSLTLTIEGQDAVSGKYYTLLAGAAVTGVSTNVYKVYPGLTAAANAVANDVVPRNGRISIAVADTDSATYSVGLATVN